jgi:hypothetical protein
MTEDRHYFESDGIGEVFLMVGGMRIARLLPGGGRWEPIAAGWRVVGTLGRPAVVRIAAEAVTE